MNNLKERVAPLLTPPQNKVLRLALAGQDLMTGIEGMFNHGNRRSTIEVLQRKGLIDDQGQITEKGRKAIADGGRAWPN